MPISTIDTFRTVVKAADVLANYQDNMRNNSVALQGFYHNGPGPLHGNLPATQQAFRDFGTAVMQALTPLSDAFNAYPVELTAAAVSPLPTLADLSAAYNLLTSFAVPMTTVVLNTEADLDNGVAALLAGIPPRALPY